MRKKVVCELCEGTGMLNIDCSFVHMSLTPCDCTKKEDFEVDLNNFDDQEGVNIINNLIWIADWYGYEIGFEDVELVGEYITNDTRKNSVLINYSNGEVLKTIELN